jgi:hypothetical protein
MRWRRLAPQSGGCHRHAAVVWLQIMTPILAAVRALGMEYLG